MTLIEPSDDTLAGLDDCTRDYIAGLEARLDAVIKKANTVIEATKDARKQGMGKTTYTCVMHVADQVLKAAEGKSDE